MAKAMSLECALNNKCNICNEFYIHKDYLCSSCHSNIYGNDVFNFESIIFCTEIYDIINNDFEKKQYFNKYIRKIWKYYCSKNNFKHEIIVSKQAIIQLFNILLGEGDCNTGKMYLMTNGFFGSNSIMTTAKVIMDVLSNMNILGYDNGKMGHVLGQLIIDPWNLTSKYNDMLKLYGISGKIPNTVRELCDLWSENKSKANSYASEYVIGICKCNKAITNKDINMDLAIPNALSTNSLISFSTHTCATDQDLANIFNKLTVDDALMTD
jgi:hypothetical protein